MGYLSEFILGISATALICAVILCFSEKSPLAPLLKLICGLVLAFALVDPILHLSAGNWQALGIDIREDGSIAAEEGQLRAKKEMAQIIKEETEAYILDKAKAFDLDLRVTVLLNDLPMPAPVGVILEGMVSPYGKANLSRIIREELGIREENQQWIS